MDGYKTANFCLFVCLFQFCESLWNTLHTFFVVKCLWHDIIKHNIKLLRHEHFLRFQNHRCRRNALWSVEYFASSLFVFLDIVHQLTDACFFSLVIGRKESARFNYISYDRLSTLLSRSIYEESTVQWLVAICYGCWRSRRIESILLSNWREDNTCFTGPKRVSWFCKNREQEAFQVSFALSYCRREYFSGKNGN